MSESDNRLTTDHRPLTTALVALAMLGAGVVAALGCGWGGFENSVRFGFTDDAERSRLPPLPFDARDARAEGVDERAVTGEQRVKEIDKVWEDAGGAINAGELSKVARLLREYLARTDGLSCDGEWAQPMDCRERRNSALDRLDALDALGRGSSADAVKSYLLARAAYDKWYEETTLRSDELYSWLPAKKAEAERVAEEKRAARAAGMQTWERDVEAHLSALSHENNLSDNAAYLRAAGIYRAGQEGDAAQAFLALVAKYPQSEKREAALYMAGRILLASSRLYAGDGATATSEDPCQSADCQDEAGKGARACFTRLLREYPRGRFRGDARGWLAYLSLRAGDTAGALVEYYRALSDPEDESGQDTALRSLRLVRGRADEADMEAVESELEDEAQAALTYAYHNIYNYTFSYYLATPEILEKNPYDTDKYSSESYEWQEHKGEVLTKRAERRELRRVAAFAGRLMRRHPRAQVGGAFAVRLAEANLELGEPKAALETARRALSEGLEAGERAQALWVEGVASYRLRDYSAARSTLSWLIDEFPRGDLAHNARRLSATIAEDAGDLAGALEQYLALGYDSDVAYFVDVLMTPDQFASFVARREDWPRRDELLYALGLRFMRAGRYPEARAALSRVRTTASSYTLASSAYGYYNPYDEDGPDHPKLNFRHNFYDFYGEGDGEYLTRSDAPEGSAAATDTRVYADWLLYDMQTLDALERLQGEIDRPQSNEARAEAMYQMASYLYEGGNLVFYNPSQWRGMRAELVGSLNETNYHAPNEAQIIWRYVQEHETAARALALYLEVVRLYPDTRAARDSLYTAILCHQRLSDFNGYWRNRYEQGLHAGERLVSLADLRRAYPQYRLPRPGVWKPSTRTVDGQPAWTAPPRPKPQTGTERARGKIKRAEVQLVKGWQLYGEIYGGRVRRWTLRAVRWLVVALTALAVLLVFRRTRRARRFLYRQLTRRCLRARAGRGPRERYAPASSYAAHVPFTWQSRFCAASGGAAHRLIRLSFKERVRAALALNLFTHGLLTLLLWAVVWAARAG